ncbi:hypothetical protein [Cytophaga hutchinsonii]|uniref:Uncharacterized protein n=1 Tax=Cytophaga hutchinsonii (strain ATCC 33406 / DSM 1761 / CIP 103989 / NBRC 15051 / NCIMB 9469 / D465) TaxID=269798 RepID=A0A6N4ST52_CYTH3|nr:hypothetical protein [Cytophaga hutchinsonii]ABG59626.1 hypothetical protein CHU_2368 [Cytophaga hutchinsonii ATCC 33406]SFX67018.1 hypothetical protein SAMN04487930_107164 [Cytophaga hutchinsonii ATCC 33406]
MDSYIYTLSCALRIDPADFGGLSNTLEITIPCSTCQRYNRTIFFEEIDTPGICTPRAICAGFPGKLIERNVISGTDLVSITHTIEFEFESFIDKKYKGIARLDVFRWARIHLIVVCRNCATKSTISVSENAVRPVVYRCTCGEKLYEEKISPFGYNIKKNTAG